MGKLKQFIKALTLILVSASVSAHPISAKEREKKIVELDIEGKPIPDRAEKNGNGEKIQNTEKNGKTSWNH